MDDTFYLVGGGPSLRGFDWDRLTSKRIIAINRAFEAVPAAEYIYFSDLRVWHWYRDALLAHRACKMSGSRVDHPSVQRYQLSGPDGIDTRPGYLRHGNSSGYAAINLAVQLGARHIVLLGYDMRIIDGHTHWHNGYLVKMRERSIEKMLPFFATAVEPLHQLGVEVVNASPNSAITVFPKIDLTTI